MWVQLLSEQAMDPLFFGRNKVHFCFKMFSTNYCVECILSKVTHNRRSLEKRFAFVLVSYIILP